MQNASQHDVDRADGLSQVRAPARLPENATAEIVQAVVRSLNERGTRGALEYLNARTRYRFTGLYRVEPPMLKNICLFDRENPDIPCSGDVNTLDETYCCIVGETGKLFVTPDARTDARLAPRGARGGVISYSGVPVVRDGVVVGTLCHFDLRPRLLWPQEVEVMEAVAPLLIPAFDQVSAVGP